VPNNSVSSEQMLATAGKIVGSLQSIGSRPDRNPGTTDGIGIEANEEEPGIANAGSGDE
jgi:hypothetical protein